MTGCSTGDVQRPGRLRSGREVAALDGDLRAGDVAGVVGEEERDRRAVVVE